MVISNLPQPLAVQPSPSRPSRIADVIDPTKSPLEQSYDDYERIEEEFEDLLDESLQPRAGLEVLFEVVASLKLPAGASVLDLGCGNGEHSLELARRFGLRVHGVDPIRHHIEFCKETLAAEAVEDPQLASLVTFEEAWAEALPQPDSSVDLIWCREVLVVIEDVPAALRECRRLLRENGRMLVYHTFATDRLEPLEAKELMGVGGVPANFQRSYIEDAFSAAGFEVDQHIELRSESIEWREESEGRAARKLRHMARLLRAPDRYIERFGREAYDIMVGDCLWHICHMTGKLTANAYLLRPGT
jgi:ubiquinone/menaquinone biosynthesis C-methylase UbiE